MVFFFHPAPVLTFSKSGFGRGPTLPNRANLKGDNWCSSIEARDFARTNAFEVTCGVIMIDDVKC